MPQFDQSTWLAYRVVAARDIHPPAHPPAVVPPGAKVAIPHDVLLAHQASGKSEPEIVARVNANWRQKAAQSLTEHAAWVAGPYHDAIVTMREKAAREAAEEQRRRALFEQIVSERREGDDAGNT